PVTIVTASRLTPKCPAKKAISASLALPFSLGAAILTFRVPSAISPASPVIALPGITFTRIVIGSGKTVRLRALTPHGTPTNRTDSAEAADGTSAPDREPQA